MLTSHLPLPRRDTASGRRIAVAWLVAATTLFLAFAVVVVTTEPDASGAAAAPAAGEPAAEHVLPIAFGA